MNLPVRVSALLLLLALAACSGSDDSAKPGLSPSASAGSTAGATTETGSVPATATDAPSVAPTAAGPVKVGKAAPLTSDVRVTVSTVRGVHVSASGPGDIAGAGVSVGLTVKNGGTKPFNLDGLAVTAIYGTDDKPAIPGGAGNGDPLTGSLRAGRSATGEYVFNVPAAQARSLQVQVSSAATPLILTFTR
jgi:hypothetical protein